MPWAPPGNISVSNSTAANLGSSGVFTGKFESVLGMATIMVYTLADQDSATDGLEFQWSGDGSTVLHSEGTSVIAGVGRAFSVPPKSPWFRVKYTNGAVAQTSFFLGVTHQPSGSGLIIEPLDSPIDNEDFALIVRSILDAQAPDATFGHVQMSTDGAIKVGPRSASSATPARIATSTTNATLLSSNADRLFVIIHNDSSRILYVKFGATATDTDYTYKMDRDDTLEIEHYTGRIDAVLSAATGNAQVTEL